MNPSLILMLVVDVRLSNLTSQFDWASVGPTSWKRSGVTRGVHSARALCLVPLKIGHLALVRVLLQAMTLADACCLLAVVPSDCSWTCVVFRPEILLTPRMANMLLVVLRTLRIRLAAMVLRL